MNNLHGEKCFWSNYGVKCFFFLWFLLMERDDSWSTVKYQWINYSYYHK